MNLRRATSFTYYFPILILNEKDLMNCKEFFSKWRFFLTPRDWKAMKEITMRKDNRKLERKKHNKTLEYRIGESFKNIKHN